jgi:hypothetical protein
MFEGPEKLASVSSLHRTTIGENVFKEAKKTTDSIQHEVEISKMCYN